MDRRQTMDDDTSEGKAALISAAKSARWKEHASLVGLLVFVGMASMSALLGLRGVGLRLGFPAMVVAGVSVVFFWTRFRLASRKSLEAEQELGAFLAEKAERDGEPMYCYDDGATWQYIGSTEVCTTG